MAVLKTDGLKTPCPANLGEARIQEISQKNFIISYRVSCNDIERLFTYPDSQFMKSLFVDSGAN